MAVAANKNPRVCAPESPKNSLAGYELKKYNPETRKHEYFIEKKLTPHSK